MVEVHDSRSFAMWLPEAAIEAHLDLLGVIPIADAWAQEWFGFGAPGKAQHWQAVPFPEGSLAFWTDDFAAGVWLSAKGRSRIEKSMFGTRPPGQELNDIDRELLESAVEQCMLDLCDRLVRGLALKRAGWAPRVGPLTCFSWPIGEDIWIGLSHDAVISSAKKVLGPVGGVGRLTSLEAALADSSIEVGASLGRCALTLAEVSSLAPGDVLQLDQTRDALLDLVIDRRIATGRTCRLVAEHDSLKLQLT